MHPITHAKRFCLPVGLMTGFAAFAALAGAQQGGETGTAPATQPSPGAQTRPAVDRERMWFAPTAEDWKKPCLVKWQRTFEDAVAVSKETGKPILICVNMDGEIASEHYAGVRYRQPEIARIYEPYVCVIASVYRHNPHDYDDQGQRIPCPRFGTVTCAEHIAIEPGLYEQYFKGQRVAPRHIGVELDRKETFDVFYAWDTDSVFKAIRDGVANRAQNLPSGVHGDRPILERVSSPHAEDREAVEKAFRDGDSATRRALFAAAVKSGVEHVELTRLALYSLDAELNSLARKALAESGSERSLHLIAEALRVEMPAVERDALVSALERIGATSERARMLAMVYRGLDRQSGSVNTEQWTKLLESASPAPATVDIYEIESRLHSQSLGAQASRAGSVEKLDVAATTLAYALNLKTAQKYSKLIFQDARRLAADAEALGATGWKLNSVVAVAEFHLGNTEEAYRRAEAAFKDMPADVADWNSMFTLALFAEGRQKAILAAVRDKAKWPPEWLADANAAYAILEKHPLGQDYQFASHFDFLRQVGAAGPAARVIEAGLARFPQSWVLHDRLRRQTLADKGAPGLEQVYRDLLQKPGADPGIEWYAGYATFLAAEYYKRASRNAESLAAYDRAMAHFESSISRHPISRDNSNHYIALGHAARARAFYESGQMERSVDELLVSFERSPDSASTDDGLGRSPVATAKIMLAKFKETGKTELVEKIERALAELDPRHLQLPAYEQSVPITASRPSGRRR
jgi:tetratricopeptide (TPR) repeat protein